jgi:site-specific DNA-methyltransferase (adenine-specific)
LTDPPYGTSSCKWDSVIPLDKMWKELQRVIKEYKPIILFGSEPFSSYLRTSNIKWFKYDWVWEKQRGSNFLNYKYQPSKNYEIISVFSNGATSFVKNNSNCPYNPQMVNGLPYEIKQGKGGDAVVREGSRTGKQIITKNNGTRYPNAIQKFNFDKEKLHPTQKPVALLEYLIKTYTNESDIVLDFTMGVGSTGVAAKNLNREFIGIELDEKYFNIAKERLQ